MKKKILITGSTDGIGKLAALKLAKEGHEIFLHGRNGDKLQKVVAELVELTDNELITGFVADFSDFNAIDEMSEKILSKIDKLDVLINNAGVFKSKNTFAENGLDLRFMVNYFAPYLLTKKLLPIIIKGGGGKIINLSSAAQAPFTAETLRGDVKIPEQVAYAQSKLALTAWSFDLAKELDTVTVIAVNPGSLLNTNMVKEGYGYHWSPADKGADILYDLAVDPRYAGETGKYFDNDRGAFGKAHEDAYDVAETEELLQTTEAILSSVS